MIWINGGARWFDLTKWMSQSKRFVAQNDFNLQIRLDPIFVWEISALECLALGVPS